MNPATILPNGDNPTELVFPNLQAAADSISHGTGLDGAKLVRHLVRNGLLPYEVDKGYILDESIDLYEEAANV
jgi:hypothetical protein